MNTTQTFALEQLEERLEQHCGWHFYWHRHSFQIGPFVFYYWHLHAAWSC